MTKRDLFALERRLQRRFDLIDARLNRGDGKLAAADGHTALDLRFVLPEVSFEERLDRALRVQFAWVTGGMAAMFVAFGLVDRLVLS